MVYLLIILLMKGAKLPGGPGSHMELSNFLEPRYNPINFAASFPLLRNSVRYYFTRSIFFPSLETLFASSINYLIIYQVNSVAGGSAPPGLEMSSCCFASTARGKQSCDVCNKTLNQKQNLNDHK